MGAADQERLEQVRSGQVAHHAPMARSESRWRLRERSQSQPDAGTNTLRRVHAWIPWMGVCSRWWHG